MEQKLRRRGQQNASFGQEEPPFPEAGLASALQEPVSKTVMMTLARPDGTGAHRMCHSFSLALHERGWRVILVTGPAPQSTQALMMLASLRDHGIEVHPEIGFLSIFPFRALRRIWQIGLAARVDLVVGFNQVDRKVAIGAARLLRVPSMVAAQNQHHFYGPLRNLKALLYGWVLRQASFVVCVSPAVEREVRERFRVPAERTEVLPNGIDVGRFAGLRTEGRPLWEAMGVGPDELVVANLGRLDPQKGQDLLVEAFGRVADRLPGLRLGLIGAGSVEEARFEQRLRARVRALGLEERVLFTGWRDDVPLLLAGADLYLHSARWEGPPGGLALLEAMACSLPAVYTDCSGHLDFFQNGVHGWTIVHV